MNPVQTALGEFRARVYNCTTLPLALNRAGREADLEFIERLMSRLPRLRSCSTLVNCYLYGTGEDLEAACRAWNEYAKSS